MKRTFLVTFLVVAIVTFVSAKGTADKITIITPNGQIVDLLDSNLIEPISMAALEKFPNSITQPNVTGKGYELARAFKNGRTYRIFDRVRYFPAGDHGYVFYVGIENRWSEYDGKWFEASAQGVKAMNGIISQIQPVTFANRLSVWAE
ncbi:MAG: hypothetical protein GC179_00570 [Anaerolineaceae bacterium]|nr:hypothetical protein [Anaerolineaceae bacterium]